MLKGLCPWLESAINAAMLCLGQSMLPRITENISLRSDLRWIKYINVCNLTILSSALSYSNESIILSKLNSFNLYRVDSDHSNYSCLLKVVISLNRITPKEVEDYGRKSIMCRRAVATSGT